MSDQKKSKPLLIFGTGEMAEVAHFYFENDSGYRVAAFTVDGQYLKNEKFMGLPVIPFEAVAKEFPASGFEMFIAVGYAKMNAVRALKYKAAKEKGYAIASYVSSKATVWPGFRAGENCFILEDNTVQPFVKIGNNVTIWSGNHIGHHSEIGDNCFIASHAVISGGVLIGENCFIGVNATVRDHVKIAKGCVIGAGALILGDTQENGVYTAQGAELSKVPSNRLKKI